jgi:glucose-6-phosphate isomerase
MDFTPEFIQMMEPAVQRALDAMEALDKGAIANPDENRMVGHYWLRNPKLAPTKEISEEIDSTRLAIKDFAAAVHSGKIAGLGGKFENLLIIGIGGSALGPQFVAHALGHPKRDKMALLFLDNTDPDGMDRVFDEIGDGLSRTLSIVISKSGGTKETRNGMLEAENAYRLRGLRFEEHAVAITMRGSELDKKAAKWIARFPMWDWVGGRTSELSAVGLLPAALQGIDLDLCLAGAAACDQVNRSRYTMGNPAAMLALAWHFAGGGCGSNNLVVLPYKDRLELFSKYLQQLIMESLGKEHDLEGNRVRQGLTVFGNKGATDQHSYIQQLRDGIDNFFALFVEVLSDRESAGIQVDPNVTSGDYLEGFLLGTREAIYESGRKSITLTVNRVTPFEVGVLIALFERAVGIYAVLVNINAYHQPGVQAGKLAADSILKLQLMVIQFLHKHKGASYTAIDIASKLGQPNQVERVFKICKHLSFNRESGVKELPSTCPTECWFTIR